VGEGLRAEIGRGGGEGGRRGVVGGGAAAGEVAGGRGGGGRVHQTGGNRSGLTGYRSNRSGPVSVSAGTQPAKIQNLNLNSKNEKFSKNS